MLIVWLPSVHRVCGALLELNFVWYAFMWRDVDCMQQENQGQMYLVDLRVVLGVVAYFDCAT